MPEYVQIVEIGTIVCEHKIYKSVAKLSMKLKRTNICLHNTLGAVKDQKFCPLEFAQFADTNKICLWTINVRKCR